jgi:hypothetical protein
VSSLKRLNDIETDTTFCLQDEIRRTDAIGTLYAATSRDIVSPAWNSRREINGPGDKCRQMINLSLNAFAFQMYN